LRRAQRRKPCVLSRREEMLSPSGRAIIARRFHRNMIS
jgi:hypothetical protein